MSTRCNLLIRHQGIQVCLYHHHDGYPEGVGAELCEIFFDRFTKKDSAPFYLDGVVNSLIKNYQGYEWSSALHGDIEYLYTVDLERRTIICEEVNNWEELKIGKKINMIEWYKRQQAQEAEV